MPRPLEAAAAGLGLVLLSPLLLTAGLAVALTSPGGALFRQVRVGRGGRPFVLYKLRTMTRAPVAGSLPGLAGDAPAITASGDARITRVGRWLRTTKIDELPGLWNVVRGDLALVGPRPEVPEYADLTDPAWRRLLEARPGLTDPITRELRHEERLLGRAVATGYRLEDFYREILLPYKVQGSLRYLENRSWRRDLAVLLSTAAAILRLRPDDDTSDDPSDEPRLWNRVTRETGAGPGDPHGLPERSETP